MRLNQQKDYYSKPNLRMGFTIYVDIVVFLLKNFTRGCETGKLGYFLQLYREIKLSH